MTPEQAQARLAAHGDDADAWRRAFCGAARSGRERFVVAAEAAICAVCVERLHRRPHGPGAIDGDDASAPAGDNPA